MLIPYATVYNLIDRFYVRKSLNGLINDCPKFEGSLETAKEIEDFRFLDHMITKRDYNDKNYVFFLSYATEYPTVLETNKDFTIAALASLAFDNRKGISPGVFVELIKDICDRESHSEEKCLSQFYGLYTIYEGQYRLKYEKIGRNEICPCNIHGKKFKHCCGQVVSK